MAISPPPDFQLRIADYPFDPRTGNRPIVRMRGDDKRPLYRIYIKLEGPDLPLVKSVNYFLHESVSPPTQYVERTETNPDCLIELWLWGTFEVNATVKDIRGRDHVLQSYYLRFDSFFQPDTFKKLGLQLKREG